MFVPWFSKSQMSGVKTQKHRWHVESDHSTPLSFHRDDPGGEHGSDLLGLIDERGNGRAIRQATVSKEAEPE